MKLIFTSLFILLVFIQSFAQDTDTYYQKIYTRPLGTKAYNAESLLKRFGDVRIRNRWYFGADGFVRKDRNSIDNDFDGLIGTESPTVSAWSVVTGWVHRETWTVEAEYARSAVHNMLVIHGDNPMRYTLENDKNVLMVRGKMRLLFAKQEIRRSAFWIGVGAGVIPNSGREKDYMEFYGYRDRGRRLGVDTLFVSSDTRVSPTATGLAEASAEYVIKVAKAVDISLFARRQWGFGNSLTTDLRYKINHVEVQQAKIEGDGTGWSFGLSLRYVFHLGYDFASIKMPAPRAN
jgi:hypothetical protein